MPDFNLEPRLKSRAEIDHLFRNGKNIIEYPVKVIFLKKREKGNINLLFSASKKRIRHSVKRNLVKRRMKEAYRKNKHQLTAFELNEGEGLSIGFIYLTSKIEPFVLIEEKIVLILQRLSKLLKTT